MEVLAGEFGKPFRHSIAVFHGHLGALAADLNNKITRKTYYRTVAVRPWRRRATLSRGLVCIPSETDPRVPPCSRRSGFPSPSISSFVATSRFSLGESTKNALQFAETAFAVGHLHARFRCTPETTLLTRDLPEASVSSFGNDRHLLSVVNFESLRTDVPRNVRFRIRRSESSRKLKSSVTGVRSSSVAYNLIN